MHQYYECPHCGIVNVYVKNRSEILDIYNLAQYHRYFRTEYSLSVMDYASKLMS